MLKNKIFKVMIILIIGIIIIYELVFFSLFSLTDKYVEGLDSRYEHYGLLNNKPELTSSEFFQVMPMVRLINVKIMHSSSDLEYEILKYVLKFHYLGNKKVNDVYRCQAGTLMIDCRRKE